MLIPIIESNQCNQQYNLNTGEQLIWTTPEFPGRGDMALFSLQLLLFFLTPFKFTLPQYAFLQHGVFLCVKKISVNDIHLLSPMGREEDIPVSIFKYFLFLPVAGRRP